MSADLLAEFDSFYTPPANKKTTNAPASNDLSFLSSPGQVGAPGYGGSAQQWQVPAAKQSGGDVWGNMSSFQPSAPVSHASTALGDIWGSFEASVPEIPKAPVQTSTLQPNNGGWGVSAVNQSQHMRVPSSTPDLFTHDMQDPPSPAGNTKHAQNPVPKLPVQEDPYGDDVLFDADAEFEDDEFGDFETVAIPEPPSQPPPAQPLENMFGATSPQTKHSKRPTHLSSTSAVLDPGALPYPQAPKSPSFRERNPFGNMGPIVATKQISSIKKESKPESPSPITVWPSFEPPKADPYQDSPAPNALDDEWGDFTDLPPEIPVAKAPRPVTGIEADAWGWDKADGVLSTGATSVTEAPPTNIPPPSLILTLFPPLFDLPQSSLFKAVANQPFSLKNRIMSDPSTIDFLRAYLLIATVAARIIAGRKLRWKRDTLLSQAMKIGPAAAGGKGGMKLAGVDKSEVVREAREAADVVRVWKDQLGRLKSAVAVANTSLKDTATHLAIPDLSETMHVKTQEGGLTAPKQCLVCGLKREERLSKVDLEVEDSFGEWWVEHWGHRACKNFWQENEGKLKGR
ncbi:serine/threonine-protein kinase ppk6 [Diplocarpon rosae]|nr:serine/threonine-protein kinase ppk6 [Diplocarpon rosae]